MDRGLSNKFINKFLYRTVNSYCGCWSSNNVPYHIITKLEYFSMVINTANQGERGEHFISVLVSPSSIRIFDSQALFSFSETLMINLKKHFPKRKIVNTPSLPIQDIDSVFCGFYVIYAVLVFDKHIKKCKRERRKGCVNTLRMNEPFQRTDLMLNDEIVVNKIIRLVKSTT